MRVLAAALLVALTPLLAGCVDPSFLGGCRTLLPTSTLSVNVTGSEEPLTKVILLADPGFEVSSICTSLPALVEVTPDQEGDFSLEPVVRQDYFEARFHFNDSILRVASAFPLRQNGTLTLDLSDGEALALAEEDPANATGILTWNGTDLPVWRLERHDNASALDPVERHEFIPLGADPHEENLTVNSSWNRGLTLLLVQKPQAPTVGATFTAKVYYPNGTEAKNATLTDRHRGPLYVHLPVLEAGTWKLVFESRTGFEPPGRLGFEAELRFRY